jgi:hypothetical protein
VRTESELMVAASATVLHANREKKKHNLESASTPHKTTKKKRTYTHKKGRRQIAPDGPCDQDLPVHETF